MKNAARIFTSVVFASAALGACAPEFNPPPGYVGGYLWESDRSRTVTVQPGDTLYIISRRYDAPTKAIAARNGLRPPYALQVGQTLILDPARRHTVLSGQTLSGIAAIYDVEMPLLAASNDLRPPYTIYPGQDLWIPDPFMIAAQPTRNQKPDPVMADLPPVAPPVRRAAITSESLAPPAGAAAPSGTVVETPPPAVAMEPPPAAAPPVTPRPAAPVTAPPAAATPTPITPEAVSEPEPQVASLPPSSLADPAPRASTRFAWPLSGKVIAGFGPAGRGLHNDGINIEAPQGTEVRAADNGVVAYAGNELRGFGNLLLIKHADGWTTAYAHNDQLLVNRGDQIVQGQVIATVGRTGNVDSPQLHFEVRKGTQAMDPMAYLAAR